MKNQKLFKKGNRMILTMIMFIVSVFFVNANVFAEEVFTEVNDVNSLKIAIANEENVKLTASFEISESIKITEKNIILDLNGYTITGLDKVSSGNFNLFEVFKGEFTVIDSVGTGTMTLKADTNRLWGGMSTMIEDHTSVVTIKGGTFTHLGGSDMAYVVNVNANSYGDATLNVYDGTLYSPYTAVRLFMSKAGTTYLNVYGGNLDGGTSAIWAQAPESKSGQTGVINIVDGDLGVVNTARTENAAVDTEISGGSVKSIKSEAGELKITGGHVEGILNILSAAGEPVESDNIITGGTFGENPKKFLDPSVAVDAAITNGEDTTYAVGEDNVKEAVASAPKGAIVEVSGDIALEKVPAGVTVKATQGSNVTANGIEVTVDGITVEEPKEETETGTAIPEKDDVKDTIENPDTSDNILVSIALASASLVAIVGYVVYNKKGSYN